MSGPWEDFTPQAQPAVNNGPWADFQPPANETVMGKTAEGTGPVAPPPTFKTAPTWGPTNAAEDLSPAARTLAGTRLDRALTGVFGSGAGLNQTAAHAAAYVSPQWGGEWAKSADDLAKWYANHAAESKARAGLKPEDTDWWNVAGQVSSPVNWGAGAGVAGAAKALPLVGRAVEGSNILQGALQGAGIGAVQPVVTQPGQDYASQKLAQVGTGTVAGGAGTAALGALGSFVKPALSKSAQILADAGVRMTPGQLLGGMTKRLEDIAQSYPFAGQLVRNARLQSGEDFQIAAANKALKPIGAKVEGDIAAGPDLIEHVEDKISREYNRIHPNVSLALDQPLAADLGGIAQRAVGKLPDQELRQLQSIIEDQITGKVSRSNGLVPGKDVQGITSELSNEIKGYRTDPSWDKKKLGSFLGDVREAVRDALVRQNPQFAPQLRKANESWMLYAKLRDAAGRQGGELGQFSPTQLESAAKRGETAGAKAKGLAPMQGFAAAGKQVLPSKVPDSGTPERAAMMAIPHLIGAGGGYAAAGIPGAVAPGLGIAALYNPAAQYLLRQAITARPAGAQALRDIINQYAPQAAGRIPLLSNGSNQ
jgi:hypothetical protein